MKKLNSKLFVEYRTEQSIKEMNQNKNLKTN